MNFITTVSLFLLSMSAYAEYRFSGPHSYRLFFDKEEKVVASLCYDDFKRCTGAIILGDFRDLSLSVQENIWRRRDVNLDNYSLVLKQSQAQVKKYELEVMKREKTVQELSKNDPKVAESLKAYLFEAKGNLNNAQIHLKYLVSNKVMVDEVIDQMKMTLSGAQTRSYSQVSAFNFKDFEWNNCRSFKILSDCFHAGIQYYVEDSIGGKGKDLKTRLLKRAMRSENQKNHFPQMTSSGLSVAILSTDFVGFLKGSESQSGQSVRNEIGGKNYDECIALETSGALAQSGLTCQALGKNWRYPKLQELKSNRQDLLRILPGMREDAYFITSEVNEFINPGNSLLIVCASVYYNPARNKSLNSATKFMRGFSRPSAPGQGAKGICVCSENC
jgi:hypothetical protein